MKSFTMLHLKIFQKYINNLKKTEWLKNLFMCQTLQMATLTLSKIETGFSIMK